MSRELPRDEDYARDFKPRDLAGRVLVTHGGIWVFELTKLEVTEVRDERTRWLKLFKEGETLDDAALPKWMHTDEMRQAMSTLRGFSEKERAYHAYQARQNYLREQSAIRGEIDELKREAEEERRRAEDEKRRAEEEMRAREEAEQERDAAVAEVARLAALLEQKKRDET